MKPILLMVCCSFLFWGAVAQAPATDLYEVIKKLITDSTGYENIGDWAVGKPQKYPIKWKADKLEMSEDTSINFFRMGEANITLQGRQINQANGQPVKWNVMLKGPRMGYGSFSIISGNSTNLYPKANIDSLFGKKPFKARLIKSCDSKELNGFYYYELKLPKKDVVFVKVGWLSLNGSAALRIDVYDNYSQYAAKLNCAN